MAVPAVVRRLNAIDMDMPATFSQQDLLKLLMATKLLWPGQEEMNALCVCRIGRLRCMSSKSPGAADVQGAEACDSLPKGVVTQFTKLQYAGPVALCITETLTFDVS